MAEFRLYSGAGVARVCALFRSVRKAIVLVARSGLALEALAASFCANPLEADDGGWDGL